MTIIKKQKFDEERALYGSRDIYISDCSFDGEADGESAFKESSDIRAERCYFNLRYPFWHVHRLRLLNSELTPLCRGALWYSDKIEISGSKLHGVKAIRECRDVSLRDCDIISPEFGWFSDGINMRNCGAESDYFMLRSENIILSDIRLKGKYSFQYIKNAVFESCFFDTKDAFWHAENVTVRNSVIKGEYLSWYSNGLTLENCRIIGTQPLCYCRNLKLINCEMLEADLCFEKSEVEATVTTPVISIKNPAAGAIKVPSVGEIIADDPNAGGKVIISGRNDGE